MSERKKTKRLKVVIPLAILAASVFALPMVVSNAFAQTMVPPPSPTPPMPLPGNMSQFNYTNMQPFKMKDRLSIFGAFGVSLVDGVKVSGITSENNQLSVTVSTGNQNQSSIGLLGNASNAAGNMSSVPAITVVAFKGSLDSIAMIQKHMAAGNFNADADHKGMMSSFGHDQASSGMQGMHGSDFMSFMQKMQIGSNVVKAGWTSPQNVTVNLVGGDMDGMSMRGSGSGMDVIFVAIVPFTGTPTS
jgi:hypothetical protein